MNNYIKLKYILVLIVLTLFFPFTYLAQAQETILTVKDESGSPVSGAYVTAGEGAEPFKTDENGEFAISAGPQSFILIEAEGFETKLVSVSSVITSGLISLSRTIFQMGEKDMANVPFDIMGKRQLTGAVSVLDVPEILKQDQGFDLYSVLNGRVSGLRVSRLRNHGYPVVVVDGVPRDADYLNLQQIEQITVLKDLSTAMLYGPRAKDGVIMVTTKRGKPFKKVMKFSGEHGLAFPISYPNPHYSSAEAYSG